jgi:hypothetical protein
MTEIFYKEEQRFRNTFMIVVSTFLWVFMNLMFAYGFYLQIVLGKPFGDKPIPDFGLIVVGLFVFMMTTALFVLFIKSNLEIIVAKDGLYYRYVPFINKLRKIDAIQILFCESRVYKPLRDFGGWGIRYNMKTRTSCYNVRGNMGVFLELANGKKLLLGSQKPHDLLQAINKILGKQ